MEYKNIGGDSMKLNSIFLRKNLEDLNRIEVQDKIFLNEIDFSSNSLDKMENYDLLYLLNFLRKRCTVEENISIEKKLNIKQFFQRKKTIKSRAQHSCYRHKIKIIEGIIEERMGFIPKKIDDEFLAKIHRMINRE